MFKIIDSNNKYILNKFNAVNKKPSMEPPVIVEIFVQLRENAEHLILFIKLPFNPPKNRLNHHIYIGISCGNGNKDFITIDTVFPP